MYLTMKVVMVPVISRFFSSACAHTNNTVNFYMHRYDGIWKKVKLIIIIDKIISGFAILNEEGSTNSHGLAQSASTSL